MVTVVEMAFQGIAASISCMPNNLHFFGTFGRKLEE